MKITADILAVKGVFFEQLSEFALNPRMAAFKRLDLFV